MQLNENEQKVFKLATSIKRKNKVKEREKDKNKNNKRI